jgi:hypothetical protein
MEDRISQQSNSDIRLFPIFIGLTMIYSWAAELGLFVGHLLTGGKWPAPIKYWIVGAIAVVLSIYKLRVPNYRTLREMRGISLGVKQALVITCFVLAWSLFGAWIMVGPPNP